MKTNTLSLRLFFFTTVWMVISLAIVAVLVSQDYRKTVENQFENLITANLYNLMGSIKPDAKGALTGSPRLGDGRYQQFKSGWYWTVGSLKEAGNTLSSTSLAGQKIPAGEFLEFDERFQRSYRIRDESNNALMVVEARVFLGEGDSIYVFRATGNLAGIDKDISEFRQRLIILLAIFGLGLIVTSFAIVRFGLNPIRRATSQLAKIREGTSEKIQGNFPQEITPLIDETNALIVSNQMIIERSRTQVGNLAHSLKTPLSVLSLELKSLPAPVAKIARKQINAMNSQIQTYLNRAMISARHGTITSRTNIDDAISPLVRTFNKLVPEINFTYQKSTNPSWSIAIEKQDFEEIIGNILENAGKFATSKVTIAVQKIAVEGNSIIEIIVDDDGAGLSSAEMNYVLKRGNRLDESMPGTGLGLSIVSDIVAEYKGKMMLEKADTGGLSVILHLPSA